ncbi:hypothetical protein C4D60_Mb06t15620 [Musa balbisiana]|uniref:Uncharacterized protein n=1 Tax=Musa balbisiana TaxID=52838 RepID=A0A4S8IPJ4_MUSBA|nr:hypothetical protein C4D60_Mb06t15620 [Musa balbisiana]
MPRAKVRVKHLNLHTSSKGGGRVWCPHLEWKQGSIILTSMLRATTEVRPDLHASYNDGDAKVGHPDLHASSKGRGRASFPPCLEQMRRSDIPTFTSLTKARVKLPDSYT